MTARDCTAAARSGVPPAFAECLRSGPHSGRAGSFSAVARAASRVAHIADCADDEPIAGDPATRALVELERRPHVACGAAAQG